MIASATSPLSLAGAGTGTGPSLSINGEKMAAVRKTLLGEERSSHQLLNDNGGSEKVPVRIPAETVEDCMLSPQCSTFDPQMFGLKGIFNNNSNGLD